VLDRYHEHEEDKLSQPQDPSVPQGPRIMMSPEVFEGKWANSAALQRIAA